MRYDLTSNRNSTNLTRVVRSLLFLGGLVLLVFSLPQRANACGLIISPTDRFDPNLPTVETAIVDCDNPFGALPSGSPFVFRISGDEVEPNTTRIIPADGIVDYQVYSPPQVFDSRHALYRHEGGNLRFVPSAPPTPTESDYEELAADFFAPNEPAQLYIDFLLGDWSVSSDPAWDWDRLNDFELYVKENFDDSPPVLLPGTYTLLSEEIIGMINTAPTWSKKLLALVIKIAHAQYFPDNRLYAMTFTLEAEASEPEGASNILFVPGIMGTRLYEHSAECGGEARERERWYSRSECDQLRLKTNFVGQSLNTIYTYANEASLLEEAGAYGINYNIYKSFLNDLESWKENELINDYSVLPYDWRLRLDDLMKSSRDMTTQKLTIDQDVPLNQSFIYETLSRLAQSANNGRVTIVAHSNGGLVVKYFLAQLTARGDPLLERIDNLILVAVPQVGTPESVIGILHGTDLDPVMDQTTSRELLNTMPFSHHLLTGTYYFKSDKGSVLTPVISFEAGTITTPMSEKFGSGISSWSALRNFMVKESGRPVPEETDLLTPQVVDQYLMVYANTVSEQTNSWQPPSSLKIHQIAGTGLVTPSGLTYFTDKTCSRRSFFRCIEFEDKLGYRVNLVADGDGTVLSPSALAIAERDGVARWWLDLKEYNSSLSNIERIHRDIFEVSDIANLVRTIVIGQKEEVDLIYLRDNAPDSTGGRLVFQLHSPLDMRVHLADGTVVGSSSPRFENVSYYRFGELQHLVIPDEENDYEVYLLGESEGSFTLDIEKHEDGHVTRRQTFSAIPSTIGTEVKIRVVDLDEFIDSDVVLKVDYDGDGVEDVFYGEDGELAEFQFDYDDLKQLIKSWALSTARTKVLLGLVGVAENFHLQSVHRPHLRLAERVALRLLEAQLKHYKNKRWLSSAQVDQAQAMINYLLK